MADSAQSTSLCLVDGREQDVLPVEDRGLAYGDGLFETLRYRNQEVPLWLLHRDRLEQGARVLGLALNRDLLELQLANALRLAAQRGLEQGVAKIIVTRGQGGRGYVPAADHAARIIFIIKPYRLGRPLGVELKTCAYRLSRNAGLAGLKHLNRLEHVLAARSAELVEGQQGLLLDTEGCLVETLHHNIFLVNEGVLRTPDLHYCGVAGTLRRAVLEIFAPALELTTEAMELTLKHLHTAEEVFICNAVQGIVPVTRWGDSRWPPGPQTELLRRRMAAEWNNFYDD